MASRVQFRGHNSTNYPLALLWRSAGGMASLGRDAGARGSCIGRSRLPSCPASPTSKRQIVVLCIQGFRKIVKHFLAFGTCGTSCHLTWRTECLGTIPLPGEQDQLPSVDLGGIASLAFTILPGAVLDAPLDVDLVSLFAVPLCDVGQGGELRVPEHHSVPLGLFLFLSGLILPLPAGGDRERGHPRTVGGAADLGIRAEISDQNRLVQTSTHKHLQCATKEWREGPGDNIGPSELASTKPMLRFPFSRMLLQRKPEHQGVFLRIAVVAGTLTDRSESRAQIECLGRLV